MIHPEKREILDLCSSCRCSSPTSSKIPDVLLLATRIPLWSKIPSCVGVRNSRSFTKSDHLTHFWNLSCNCYSLQGVQIRNFSSSWSNGLAFCAVIHRYFPEEFNFDTLSANEPRQNLDLAFNVALYVNETCVYSCCSWIDLFLSETWLVSNPWSIQMIWSTWVANPTRRWFSPMSRVSIVICLVDNHQRWCANVGE